jgi:hypothetical protein
MRRDVKAERSGVDAGSESYVWLELLLRDTGLMVIRAQM